MSAMPYNDLPALAVDFRQQLTNSNKKFILLYAYNGIGKTRLSTTFKDIGKLAGQPDTLYFNAFTEDLFSWHNDLAGDSERYLILHPSSNFFAGLEELEMDNRIRPLLQRYTDLDFRLDTIPVMDGGGRVIRDERIVRFSRDVVSGGTAVTVDNIKISRGEENIFIWCFFLAIVQLAIDDDGTGPYSWVKYIYVDDPISSLDEQNAIAVANHLMHILKDDGNRLRAIISTHHTLFFNVLCNDFRNKAHKYQLKRIGTFQYVLEDTSSRPFLHHLSTLVELHEAQLSGALYSHHFTMMRRVMEQTANYFGIDDWSECIQMEGDDADRTLAKRMIDIMSHGDYLLFEAREMVEENKRHFRNIFRGFITGYPFKPSLFPVPPAVPQSVSTPNVTP